MASFYFYVFFSVWVTLYDKSYTNEVIMGAYQSTPVTKCESVDSENSRVRYGASSMQGWRRTQEVCFMYLVKWRISLRTLVSVSLYLPDSATENRRHHCKVRWELCLSCNNWIIWSLSLHLHHYTCLLIFFHCDI